MNPVSFGDLLVEHLSTKYRQVEIIADSLCINELWIAFIVDNKLEFGGIADDMWSNLEYNACDPEFFNKLDATLTQIFSALPDLRKDRYA